MDDNKRLTLFKKSVYYVPLVRISQHLRLLRHLGSFHLTFKASLHIFLHPIIQLSRDFILFVINIELEVIFFGVIAIFFEVLYLVVEILNKLISSLIIVIIFSAYVVGI